MNFKCLFGFHDYQPVDGLWWRCRYIDYDILPPSLIGIEVIKIFKCSKCNKVYEKCIEYYSKVDFNICEFAKTLENKGIYHISNYAK